MPSGPDRTVVFQALDSKYGFGEQALASYGSSLRKSWVRSLVGAQETQVEGRNAFCSVKRWGVGLFGKPKFRSYYKRKALSAECKDSHGDIWPVMSKGKLVRYTLGTRFWGSGSDVPIPG